MYNSHCDVNTHKDTKQGVDTEHPKPTATDCILHTTLTQSLTYTLRVTPTQALLPCHTQTLIRVFRVVYFR